MSGWHITGLGPSISGLETGDPDLSVEGTGLSIPWGVDAVFEYNGLIFNDTTTVDKIRVISIDGLDDPDIRDVREENPADDGEIPYDSSYSGRTLVFNGRIEAFQRDKLRDMQLAIRSAFSDLKNEKPLHFITNNSATYHYINCKKNQKLQWSEEQKDSGTYYRDFQITVRASNPRFLRRKQSKVNIVLSESTQGQILNFGNYWAEPKIMIFGPMSEVEFNIENSDASIIQTFKLKEDVTIADGDTYIVDVANKTMVNSLGQNKFFDIDPTSDFPKIIDNSNLLVIPEGKCTGIDTDSEIDIIFRDSFI